MNLIYGVQQKSLRVIPDERGRLMEILRKDDELFTEFGQVYITTAYRGVVKGWHYHKFQWDKMACVHGMMKLVLYDSRKESPTKNEVNEIFFGVHNPLLITIPPYVYHGFKCISKDEALVVNIPDRVYNYSDPDEYRVDPFDNDIPYKWDRKNG